jgi:glycerate kinase
MNILLVPNSFKECADSVTLAELFTSNLSLPKEYNLISKPLSDGGDGFLRVCQKNFGLEILHYNIPAPYGGRIIKCPVGYSRANKNIFIESANVLGLKTIPSDKRHPLVLSSRGMGVLLNKIMKEVKKGKLKVNDITIGVGGTGTNDLGIGMLAELGMKLIDKNNSELEPLPLNFRSVKKILWNGPEFPFKINLVTDVNNPLLGTDGATFVYGRQKGLTAREIKIADAGFENIISVSKEDRIIRNIKFISGAGGGLAAGFRIFLGSKIIRSDKFIAQDLGINKRSHISAVITSEGRFDIQSFMNKATGIIIKKYSHTNTKIFLVCGTIDKKVISMISENVYLIELSKFFKSKADSIKYYKQGIKLACEEIKMNLI